MKEFAPSGSKFFPYRVDQFSEGNRNNFDRVGSLESISIPLNIWYKDKYSCFPLTDFTNWYYHIDTYRDGMYNEFISPE